MWVVWECEGSNQRCSEVVRYLWKWVSEERSANKAGIVRATRQPVRWETNKTDDGVLVVSSVLSRRNPTQRCDNTMADPKILTEWAFFVTNKGLKVLLVLANHTFSLAWGYQVFSSMLSESGRVRDRVIWYFFVRWKVRKGHEPVPFSFLFVSVCPDLKIKIHFTWADFFKRCPFEIWLQFYCARYIFCAYLLQVFTSRMWWCELILIPVNISLRFLLSKWQICPFFHWLDIFIKRMINVAPHKREGEFTYFHTVETKKLSFAYLTGTVSWSQRIVCLCQGAGSLSLK